MSVCASSLLSVVPGARMTVIEGTGHLSPLEAPGEVAHLLDQFAADDLERLAAGRTPGA
jgi:pimeloyl-ACP methyl ester carboxylesterase